MKLYFFNAIFFKLSRVVNNLNKQMQVLKQLLDNSFLDKFVLCIQLCIQRLYLILAFISLFLCSLLIKYKRIQLKIRPLQYCKVISLQLIKISEEKKRITDARNHVRTEMAEPCYKSSLLNRAKVTSESQELQIRDPSCQFFYIHSIFLVAMFLIVINYEKIVNH